ncbi:ABC transporter ATP-binding protein [Glycomyces buryatensis]|uniref:ABC transporter ATP-binding protein n=1 Tax=Glycomyces buryatensis TaxID=2570927 RepID=UPI0014562C59|nr:ABC transporter ATP-binding protein [Glycomyces buryatensis]
MSRSESHRLPTSEPREVRRAAIELFGHEKGTVALACLLYLAAAGAGAALPVMLGRVIDGIGDGWSAGRIDLVCAVLFGCIGAQMILVRVGRRVSHRFGDRSAARVRERALGRALRLPLGTIERAGTGDLTTRTTGDVAAVAGLLRYTGPEVVAAIIELIVLIVAAFVIDPLLALGLAAVLPPLALVSRWYLRAARQTFLAERAAMSELADALTASSSGARTVAAHHLQAERGELGHRLARAHYRTLRRIISLQSRFLPSLDLAYLLPVFAVLIGGGLWALSGGVKVGAVVASTMLAYRLAGPLDRIMYSLTEFQSAGAALARVEGIGKVPLEDRPGRPIGTAIELADVRFGYDDHHDVLHALSLRPRVGEHLAVVGPSGAGKSTVARLIAGIEPPRSGTATIGGVGSATIELESLRRNVILVTQEHHVFHASLRDNLALAADRDDDALREALHRVGAAWATDLPDGLDTVVGGDAHRLTPAQAQQLALARVVLADPEIVILDEATAGLDADAVGETEAALSAALSGRTVITIAHQLQVARGADRIAVVDNGRVVETGTHTGLVHRGGVYAGLWEAWNRGRQSN